MWGCEDVKMWRCEDVKMWMWRCEDVQMWGYEDVKMWRCEDVRMWRCEDVMMWRCEDVKMWWCEDVKMCRCEDMRMWRCADVRIWGCEDVKMWWCEDVKMWRCEDVKMWKYADPTFRRTLRSDALGNKSFGSKTSSIQPLKKSFFLCSRLTFIQHKCAMYYNLLSCANQSHSPSMPFTFKYAFVLCKRGVNMFILVADISLNLECRDYMHWH